MCHKCQHECQLCLFSLPGLGGSPRLADVGGVPYLMPLVQRDKVMKDIILYIYN